MDLPNGDNRQAPSPARRRLQIGFVLTGVVSAVLAVQAVFDAPVQRLQTAVRWPMAPVLAKSAPIPTPVAEPVAAEPSRPKLRAIKRMPLELKPEPVAVAKVCLESEPLRERREPLVAEDRATPEPAAKDTEPAQSPEPEQAPEKSHGVRRLFGKVAGVFHIHRKSVDAPAPEAN